MSQNNKIIVFNIQNLNTNNNAITRDHGFYITFSNKNSLLESAIKIFGSENVQFKTERKTNNHYLIVNDIVTNKTTICDYEHLVLRVKFRRGFGYRKRLFNRYNPTTNFNQKE